jgi:hypothetical protein
MDPAVAHKWAKTTAVFAARSLCWQKPAVFGTPYAVAGLASGRGLRMACMAGLSVHECVILCFQEYVQQG